MARREELLHLRYNQRREDLIDFFLMLFSKVDRDTGQQLAFRLVQQSRGTVSQIKILSWWGNLSIQQVSFHKTRLQSVTDGYKHLITKRLSPSRGY